jgi:hypothetical protein
MNRRELLKASMFLPAVPTIASASPRGSAPPATLHVTFLYHCAFARGDAGRRTDVILSPSSSHAHGQHGPAHVALLRVPAAYVLNDSELPGTDDQGDRIWRLDGYDLSWTESGDGSAPTTRAPEVSLDGGITPVTGAPSTWTIADLNRLTGVSAIDQACLADDPPAFLQRGARVRLTGGHLGCGLPTTQGLRETVWALGDGQPPIGLTDRADFLKPVDASVAVAFRRFGETTTRRVRLRPDQRGLVRAFVSNDPVDGKGDCSALPHFALYYLLSTPVGQPKAWRVPTIHSQASLRAEGNTACCPCSGGGPTWP